MGHDNFFLCGAYAEDINRLRAERAAGKFVPDARFTETMDYIKSGIFGDFSELLSSLEGNEGFGCAAPAALVSGRLRGLDRAPPWLRGCAGQLPAVLV